MQKLFLTLIITSIYIVSCTNKEVKDFSMLTLLKTFPIENIDNLIDEISADDWIKLLQKEETESWKIEQIEDNQFKITNKFSGDNEVNFNLLIQNENIVIVVQQFNAQVTASAIWQYHEDFETKWDRIPFPKVTISDFIAENVSRSAGAENDDMDIANSPYLYITFSNDTINCEINEWTFFRELAEYYQCSEEAFSKNYVKYSMYLIWNGTEFVQNRKLDSNYREVLDISTSLVGEEDPDGPGLNAFHCPWGVTVTASSELPTQDSLSYQASNVLDEKDYTGWVEGNANDGIGEWIEFTVVENYLIGESYRIKNGYTKSPGAWSANNRVKSLKAYINDKLIATVTLQDSDDFQDFNLIPNWIKDALQVKKGDKIRFVIDDIYKGQKYNDTVISCFIPTGNCG